jgi:RecB family exonuclease
VCAPKVAGVLGIETFVARAVAWCRTGEEADLVRVFRSPYSGVPHDAAAAYATLAARTGRLLETIDEQRLMLPNADREAALAFARRMRRLCALAQTLQDEALRAAVGEVFELDRSGPGSAPLTERGSEPIALADPVQREAPAGVHPRQQHFSASALNTYAECPRKWFYRYACGAIEDRGSAASAYGTAFHLALEDFHAEFPRPNPADEARMRERISELVTWAFERNRDGFPTRIEFELQRRRAQRTSQRYVNWLIATAAQAPFTVVGREVPANLELEGHSFVGFIDRLDSDDRTGEVTVVDYKTGTIAADAADYRKKLRNFGDFQLPFYYCARTAQGDRVTRLVLIPLKDALLDVRPVVLAADAPVVADLERARSKMIALCDELSSARVQEFPVTQDAAACTYCAYATACADRPPAQPKRFGR